MKKINPTEYVLFIYQAPGSPDFYVLDRGKYARFVWLTTRYCFVRVQAHLPAYASGWCVSFKDEEKQALEKVAEEHHVRMKFFESAETCLQAAAEEMHAQHIYGQTAPAGYFWADSAFRGNGEE